MNNSMGREPESFQYSHSSSEDSDIDVEAIDNEELSIADSDISYIDEFDLLKTTEPQISDISIGNNVTKVNSITINEERRTKAGGTNNQMKRTGIEKIVEGNSSCSSVVSMNSSKSKKRKNVIPNLHSGNSSHTTSEVTLDEKKIQDKYCWSCHKNGKRILECNTCPRVFHFKCLDDELSSDTLFYCSECLSTLKADSAAARLKMNLEQLSLSLVHAVSKMRLPKYSVFWIPIDSKLFPEYENFVVYPMDLSIIRCNAQKKLYGSTEALLADVKWIVHNSIIFNSNSSKIAKLSKELLKDCEQELARVMSCVECYYRSKMGLDDWFLEVCKKPHVLLWVKLKGYPRFPAKAMRFENGNVEAWLFGTHDRCWVNLKDCHLYSEEYQDVIDAVKYRVIETEKHVGKLRSRYGCFLHAPSNTAYDPFNEINHLQMMLPRYNPGDIHNLPSVSIPTDDISETTQVSPVENKTVKQNLQKAKTSKNENKNTAANNSSDKEINSNETDFVEIIEMKSAKDVIVISDDEDLIEIATAPLKIEEIKYSAKNGGKQKSKANCSKKIEKISLVSASDIIKLPKRANPRVNTKLMKKLKANEPLRLPDNITISLVHIGNNSTPKLVNHKLESTNTRKKEKVVVNENSERPCGVMNSENELKDEQLNRSRNNSNENVERIVLEERGNLVEDSDPYREIAALRTCIEAQEKFMLLQNEKMKMELDKLKTDYDHELEKREAAFDKRLKTELDLEKMKFMNEKRDAVNEAKSGLWCVVCKEPADYYCCWNAAYCTLDCQHTHWEAHAHNCGKEFLKLYGHRAETFSISEHEDT